VSHSDARSNDGDGDAVLPIGDTRFRWRGIARDGRHRRGSIVAEDAGAARGQLAREDIVVLSVLARGPARRPRATSRDITAFTRQLAGLLRAGLPLLHALSVLERTSGRGGLPRIVRGLARRVAAGTRFATALGAYRLQFDTLYRQLVLVGEASGALATVLERMAHERERRAAQRAKLRAALAYPAAVLLLALALTGALLIAVVPTFTQVFEAFGAALPAPTRLVIALSQLAAHVAVPAAMLGASAAVAVPLALKRSSALRAWRDRTALALPVVGPLLRTVASARWSRALGTLLAAGLPLADAFGALAHATGNAVFDAANVELEARLGRGERLAHALQALGCFPASLVQPIAVAEESGALDATLLDVAALAEREVDEQLATLASLVEPCVVVLLSFVVGSLVVALYLPIIELGNVV
jgi:type IV pilus assembly protein PilC